MKFDRLWHKRSRLRAAVKVSNGCCVADDDEYLYHVRSVKVERRALFAISPSVLYLTARHDDRVRVCRALSSAMKRYDNTKNKGCLYIYMCAPSRSYKAADASRRLVYLYWIGLYVELFVTKYYLFILSDTQCTTAYKIRIKNQQLNNSLKLMITHRFTIKKIRK